MGLHKKDKICISAWLEQKLLEQINEEAGRLKVPRSTLIENYIREKYGLPPILPSPKATKSPWEVKYQISKKNRQK